MLTLSQALKTEKNKKDSGNAWLVFLKITLVDSTVLYFVKNTEAILYDGNRHLATDFKMTPVESSVEGILPTTTLSVSNAGRIMQGYARDQSGCEGATVLITYVNSGHLSEDYSELEMETDVVKCDADENWVNFHLGAPNPLNRLCPLYEYGGIICRFIFKEARCGYVGTETTCDKTLAACLAYDNTARFGNFIALQAGGVSFV